MCNVLTLEPLILYVKAVILNLESHQIQSTPNRRDLTYASLLALLLHKFLYRLHVVCAAVEKIAL